MAAVIQRGDLIQQVDPNRVPNFQFNANLFRNGQIQNAALPDPAQLARVQNEFERQMALQNAIVGRQHAPQQVTANQYGRQDMQTAARFGNRLNTGLADMGQTMAGLGPEPFFVSNISRELQANGEQLRQMAMAIPPTQQAAMLGRERMFYRGIENDFVGNYMAIYNQRQRENDMYAFV